MKSQPEITRKIESLKEKAEQLRSSTPNGSFSTIACTLMEIESKIAALEWVLR